MAEDVVTGDAVHARADEARRMLHAAQRRRTPAEPRPRLLASVPEDDGPDEEVPEVDPVVQQLVAENRSLRAEVASLRDALDEVRDRADRALDS